MIQASYHSIEDRFVLHPAGEARDFEAADAVRLMEALVGLRYRRAVPSAMWIPATAWHWNALATSKVKLQMDDDTIEHAYTLMQQQQRLRNALIDPADNRHRCNSFTQRTLFSHQQGGIKALEVLGYRAMLCDEMGLGKTLEGIVAFKMSEGVRMLLVCPATIKDNWCRELEQEGLLTHVVHGSPKARERRLLEFLGQPLSRGVLHVLDINYELLIRHLALIKPWVAGQFCICSESHYVKNWTAERTKAVRELDPAYFILETGTPIRNRCIDVYSQITLLRHDFFRGAHEFKERFIVEVEHGNRKIQVNDKNPALLKSILDTMMIRRRKADVLNLPPIVHALHTVELEPESRKAYKLMADRWLYHYGDLDPDLGIFDKKARSATEMGLRLEQICSGYLSPVPPTPAELEVGPGGVKVHDVGAAFFQVPAKLLYIAEMIEDLRQQNRSVLVLSKFNKPLHWLNLELSGKVALLTGQVPVKDRDALIQSFNSEPGSVLLCQVKIAEGFNATGATDIVFVCKDWSPAVNEQAIARCHRIGTKGTVNVNTVFCSGTLERSIHRRIERKGSLAALTLGDLQEAIEDVSKATA